MRAQEHTSRLMFSGEIVELTGYSLQHLRRMEATGQFPRRFRLGANRVAWIRDEIEQWLANRVEVR